MAGEASVRCIVQIDVCHYVRCVSSVILMVNVAELTKPESKPADVLLVAARYVQGAANDD